jgi:hypothetical protein
MVKEAFGQKPKLPAAADVFAETLREIHKRVPEFRDDPNLPPELNESLRLRRFFVGVGDHKPDTIKKD